MFVSRDRADVAVSLARGAFRLADNHGFAGAWMFHIANGLTGAEGARHRWLRESAALGAFVLGRQKRKIVAVAPEFGADQIQILAGTGLVLIAVD